MYCNEIRPYWIFATKGYGLSIEDIDWSSPADLEPYGKAKQIEENEKDIGRWQLGQYISVAIGSSFSKNCKYPEKPMFQLKDEVDLSDEEIYERELRKALLAEEQWIIAGKQKGLKETII